MIHHYISITTYFILFPFASYRKLFTGRGIDIHKQLSHVPKILFLDFFLKISLVESLLYFDSQKKLPKEFGQLSNLTHLYLGSNRFTVFPVCLLKLDHLEWLSLSYNQISDLPKQLANMYNLKKLYIISNKIDNDSFKKSDVYQLITSKPTHVFKRDTGEVEPNKEKLVINNWVVKKSISSLKSEDLLRFIILSISSLATFGFIFKQLRILDLILSDTYFFLGVGIMMFLLAFNLRRKNLITAIPLAILSSIVIGLFLVWIYQ